MNKQFKNKISFLSSEPQNVRLMFCPACKIETNHVRTPNGWKCRVCDDVIKFETILEQRQETILYEVARDPGLLTDDVVEELADLGKTIDGGSHDQ